jgi:peptidoglycan/LPS O-acetylase OafA/YrhL
MDAQARRDDLDGLRALACAAVLAYHYFPSSLQGGFGAVDVFYVLSGHLVTLQLVRSVRGGGRVDVREFYARRIRRLLPASAAVLGVTLLASVVWIPPGRRVLVAQDGIATAGYVVNHLFAWRAMDYQNVGASPSPLLHYWSLSLEEQMYLLWPWLFAIGAPDVGRMRRRLALLGGASFGLCLWWTQRHQPWAFFTLPARAWEPAAGGLLALMQLRLPARVDAVTGWGGLALLGATFLVFDEATPFPGWAALAPVGGAILVVASRSPAGSGALLGHPWLALIGRMSYSIYLCHWPGLVLYEAKLGRPASSAERAVILCVSLFVAVLCHRWVEEAARRSRWLAVSPSRSFAFFGLVTAASVAMGAVLARGAARKQSHKDECLAGIEATTNGRCVFGDVGAGRTIVLFGDSHADQWRPALAAMASVGGYRLVSLTKSGCPAATVEVRRPGTTSPFTECDQWRAATLRRINEVEKPDVVIVTSSSIFGASKGDSSGWWGAGLSRTLEQLVAPGRRLLLIHDTPRPVSNVPDCLAAHPDAPSACDIAADRRYAHEYRAVERSSAQAVGAAVVDPGQWLCRGDVCPVVVEGEVAYRDHSHLSEAVAMRLKERLWRALGLEEGRSAGPAGAPTDP